MARGAGEISIPMSDVMKNLTLTIKMTGARRFALRMKIAEWIFRLGGRVAGVGIVVER